MLVNFIYMRLPLPWLHGDPEAGGFVIEIKRGESDDAFPD